MDGSARTLSSASEAVRTGFEQYERSRRAVEEQVSSLQQLVEIAKAQTGFSTSLINEMSANVEKVKAVHQESRQHLDDVNAALATAFEKFGQQLVTQITNSIKETDKHLGASVGHLSAIVDDYSLAVQRLSKLKN
jgi:Arc/MetJ-type ribon-helix-helix transcriptional regulator